MQPLASAIANAFDGTCKRLHQPSPPTYILQVCHSRKICLCQGKKSCASERHAHGKVEREVAAKLWIQYGIMLAPGLVCRVYSFHTHVET